MDMLWTNWELVLEYQRYSRHWELVLEYQRYSWHWELVLKYQRYSRHGERTSSVSRLGIDCVVGIKKERYSHEQRFLYMPESLTCWNKSQDCWSLAALWFWDSEIGEPRYLRYSCRWHCFTQVITQNWDTGRFDIRMSSSQTLLIWLMKW